MSVFRAGRRRLRTAALLRALASDLAAAAGGGASASPAVAAMAPAGRAPGDAVVTALVRAGALECALDDAAAGSGALVRGITDELASALVAGAALRPSAVGGLRRRLAAVTGPAWLETSPAEGFAYYGLHPLDYVGPLEQVAVAGPAGAVVVGIRTIGTALSAVAAAALRARGIRARRLTVRPEGHPYHRRTELSPEQARIVRAAAPGATFVIVDEGPGLSGSSFLSVGEALVRLGASPGRTWLLCSRPPDPERLVAPAAAERWRAFRVLAPRPAAQIPAEAGRSIGAGRWRALFWEDPDRWPASWTSMERAKLLSRDGRTLFKFEGLGPYGHPARRCAERLVAEGFLPEGSGEVAGAGYLAYPFLPGRPMRRGDLSPRVLEFLAAYCAARGRMAGGGARSPWLPGEAVDPVTAAAGLEEAARVNAGVELGWAPPLTLEVTRTVLPDGRMMPHEFVLTERGRVYKLDAVGHGDDHFLPGPTDVAWDLAGVIVEWALSADASAAFLAAYRRRSGDEARPRLHGYVLAYALFRTAYWRMAAAALHGSDEAPRLAARSRSCRAALDRLLAGAGPPRRRR
jgi:hypothetical protein